MSYVLKGVVAARISADQTEPLADVTLRFYLDPSRAAGAAEAGSFHDEFAILTPEEERTRETYLVGQARTSAQGEFEIDLATRTVFGHRGWTGRYQGEPLVIDVFCRDVPGRAADELAEPVQFSLGYLVPDWQPAGAGSAARFEYTLAADRWSDVRARFDAWSIVGRVVDASNTPLTDLRVLAFDADLVQDDALGSAVTDQHGRFRIDYSSRDFQRTLVPGVKYEQKGPDVYFRVEAGDGRLLLDEGKEAAGQPERKDVRALLWAELRVPG